LAPPVDPPLTYQGGDARESGLREQRRRQSHPTRVAEAAADCSTLEVCRRLYLKAHHFAQKRLRLLGARERRIVKLLMRLHRKSQPHHSSSKTPWYVSKQIRVANIIGAQSAGDPWPNCPDPFDGGGSWYATVGCENGGSWLDSPGYYRCGLQFDPMWERKYGKLCP